MLDGADDDASLWSVCSTELGNSVIGIRKDRGLVGKAVTLVEDVTIDDAYSDPAFNQRVDKATSFLTKSVCCCVLQEGGEVRAVVQHWPRPGHANSAVATCDEWRKRLGRCPGVGKVMVLPLLGAFDALSLVSDYDTYEHKYLNADKGACKFSRFVRGYYMPPASAKK